MIGNAPESATIEVFFSYSHNDEVLRDELEKHLSQLKPSGWIERSRTTREPVRSRCTAGIWTA